jgi:predicted double-glycine peptidase
MSNVKVEHVSGSVLRTVMGAVEEQEWTVIAADSDGVILEDEIGKRHRRRRTHFAFHEEALAWVAAHEKDGWKLSGDPCPCATAFFGPTDSPSNCWSVEVEKEVS